MNGAHEIGVPEISIVLAELHLVHVFLRRHGSKDLQKKNPFFQREKQREEKWKAVKKFFIFFLNEIGKLNRPIGEEGVFFRLLLINESSGN